MTTTIAFQWNDRTHSMASIMRDIQNGTATIMREASRGSESGVTGLYLPHGLTMWIIFTDSSSGNNPDWNNAYYKITSLEERITYPVERQALWNHGWESAGNSHALASKYTRVYSEMIGQDDGYWTR
jgi:hypothetical protein